MTQCTSSSPDTSIPSTSEYERDPETGAVRVPLHSRAWPGSFALIDAEDVPLIQGFRWRALRTAPRGDRIVLYAWGYAYTPKRIDVYMHRLILGLTDRRVKVDHENHNGLDNRRCNLRVGTHQQNVFNRRPNLHGTSRYKGVSWYRPAGKWQVHIRFNGRQRNLGLFDDEREAAEVYDGAALMLFGSRAYLNFPDGEGGTR